MATINDRYFWNVDEYNVHLGQNFKQEIYEALPRTDHDEIYGIRRLYLVLCYLQDLKDKVIERNNEIAHKYAELSPCRITYHTYGRAYSLVKDIYEKYDSTDLLSDDVLREYETYEDDERIVDQYKRMHQAIEDTAEVVFTLANIKPSFKEEKAKFEEYDPVKEEREKAKEDEYGYDEDELRDTQIDDAIDDIRDIGME